MSIVIDRGLLLQLAAGDEELLGLLRAAGLLPADGVELTAEQADVVRVAQTLRAELEVNWPGVEVILRLRAELVATRRQLHALVRALHESAASASSRRRRRFSRP